VALRVEVDAETYLSVLPALEIGGEFEREDGTRVRPRLTLGMTHFLNDPEPSLTARFVNAPDSVADFVNSTTIDETRFNVTGGIDLVTRRNAIVRADVFVSVSEHADIYGGLLRVEIPF